jgi:hypothetical protein
MKSLLNVTMSENDTRMLVILLIVLLVVFFVMGLLGMAIRKVCQLQAGVIDQQMGEPVRYKVISDPTHFKKLAKKKNNRLLVKEAVAPLLIGFIALMFYIIYSGLTGEWNRNYFGEFGTLLFTFDFKNATYSDFWGFKNVLTDWPPVIAPSPKVEYWPSYVLCPLVIISATYYLIVIQGFVSRSFYLHRICRDVFDVSLKNYKYYDHVGTDPYGRPLNPTETPVKEPSPTEQPKK